MFIIVKPALPGWVFYILLIGYAATWWFVFKRLKHKLSFFLFFILLAGTVWFTLQVPAVQTWLVGKVASKLSKELHTKININHINLHFFDKLDLKGLYVEDQHKDTLLYAGSATIKITDWFFLKDKITLHYVALEDAQVNMSRNTDSVWNHQFLIDFFSSPKKEKDTTAGIELKVEEMQLKNIVFRQIDKWKGKDQIGSLKSLNLFADTFDLKKGIISISKLDIDSPSFSISDYTGERDRQGWMPPPYVKKEWQQHKGSLVLSVKKLRITNGAFANDSETARAAYADVFDGSHIRFSSISADMENLRLANDTLSTNITLATKEQSGFEVKKLQANMKFTPEVMEFNNLDLQTNKSRLGNYYSMRYEDFDEDMGHFLHNIRLQGNFANSELNTDDLAFFAPEVKSWKRVFSFSGNARGTIDNLVANKMVIKSGNTSVDGDITIRGLPDIETAFIDFASRDLKTNYGELVLVVPSLKTVEQPKLNRLGNISYKGNFTGTISDFVAFGTINTNLGIVTGDLNLKLPANSPSVYSGQLSTQNFRLGQFLDDNKLGLITFNGKVNGSGVSSKNLDAKFNGNLRNIEYDGYNYQNISLNGSFKKKFFNGLASIDDPNLKIDKLTGTIDFNGAAPQFNFDASLAKSDFKNLGITGRPFQLKGRFLFNFTGSDIDNFTGAAEIKDAQLMNDGVPLSFDSLVMKAQEIGNQKYLSLSSNEVDASLSGQFKIKELPDAFQFFLSRYYPAYIKKPSGPISNQDFSFEIKTKNIDEYIQLVDKKLKGFNNSTINGNLKLQSNELNVNAEVPEFSYDGRKFTNVMLQGRGNFDSLSTTVTAEDIAITDSLHLPFTDLHFVSSNDVSDVSLKTSASKTLSEASVNARLTTLSDGVKIHFFPSSFIINDRKWQLEKDGEVSFSKSLVSASGVKFVNGNQQINISTQPSETGSSNDIVINLSKVQVGDIAAFGLKEPALEGEASGTVIVENPFGKPYIEYDLKTEAFKFGDDSIGLLKSKGYFDAGKGVLYTKTISDNKDNNIDIEGTVNLKDSSGVQTNMALKSKKLNLSFLNAYLGDLFTDIKGTANTSDFSINSDGKNTVITGTAHIDSASLIVNYTQCKYSFNGSAIFFKPNEIDFGTIKLKDTLNNTASLSGKLYHRFFSDMEFGNIALNSDKLLVLNTTRKDNPQFYGKVIGKAGMSINGTQNNILMAINGEPSLTDSSHVYIVSGNSIEKEDVDYIDFVQFGTAMEEKYKSKSAANVLVKMGLTANPACKVDVILDEATGDVIKGTGNGYLDISVGNKEDLKITGRYDITQGEYTFNFQTFLKKYFTVNSGSIIWNGDPFNAAINIAAEYMAENVDLKALSSNSTSYGQKSNVQILARLTNTLMKPDIAFDIKLPPGSNPDFMVVRRLEQFKQDENDMNKQITSLLLFNSFISSNESFITTSSYYSILSNTIGGVVSGAVSNFFNSLLQKYVKNLSFNFDFSSSLDPKQLEQNVSRLQAAAKSNFVYTVFNGKLIITAGLNLDYNNPYANKNTGVLVTPDVTLEWIFTKSGRLRLVAFNRTNYDLVGQRNRTGLSLAYRKDFSKIAKAIANVLFVEWCGDKKAQLKDF